MDIRYYYDKETNDRFGDTQLEWLEEKLSSNSDSNLTIIAQGVHVLPDRYIALAEYWARENKERVFSIIRRLRKSGVIFLSGDVHYS